MGKENKETQSGLVHQQGPRGVTAILASVSSAAPHTVMRNDVREEFPLHHAVDQMSPESVARIMQHDPQQACRINAAGETPLMRAVARRKYGVIAALLTTEEGDSAAAIPDNAGLTPIQFIVAARDTTAFSMLTNLSKTARRQCDMGLLRGALSARANELIVPILKINNFQLDRDNEITMSILRYLLLQERSSAEKIEQLLLLVGHQNDLPEKAAQVFSMLEPLRAQLVQECEVYQQKPDDKLLMTKILFLATLMAALAKIIDTLQQENHNDVAVVCGRLRQTIRAVEENYQAAYMQRSTGPEFLRKVLSVGTQTTYSDTYLNAYTTRIQCQTLQTIVEFQRGLEDMCRQLVAARERDLAAAV